jgi:hypothetical protein
MYAAVCLRAALPPLLPLLALPLLLCVLERKAAYVLYKERLNE